MSLSAIISSCAALASIASFVPQAWKIIRTHKTKDISSGMYVLTVSAFALWTIYGIMTGQWALVASNSICLLLSGSILAMKSRGAGFSVGRQNR